MLKWYYDGDAKWRAKSSFSSSLTPLYWTVSVTQEGLFMADASSDKLCAKPLTSEFTTISAAKGLCQDIENQMLSTVGKRIHNFDVGDCVIINHVEAPQSRMVCVVVAVEDDRIFCKYLNKDTLFSTFNKRGGMEITNLKEVTTIETFGVRLRFQSAEGGICYWCEKVGESKATYTDGLPRLWQEFEPRRHTARWSVLRYVKKVELTDVGA